MATRKYTEEEARDRHNASQREYAKRTNHESTNKSHAKNSKTFLLRMFYSTESDILEKLESVENINGYIKSLIRADIEKGK